MKAESILIQKFLQDLDAPDHVLFAQAGLAGHALVDVPSLDIPSNGECIPCASSPKLHVIDLQIVLTTETQHTRRVPLTQTSRC